MIAKNTPIFFKEGVVAKKKKSSKGKPKKKMSVKKVKNDDNDDVAYKQRPIPTNEDEDDEIDMGDEVEEVGFEKDDSEDDDF